MAERGHEELRRLFDLVIAAPVGERGAVLERECRGDGGLRKRIEGMIAAAEDEVFLSEATADVMPSAGKLPTVASRNSAALLEGPGTKIGPYKLLQLIGEGGFGSVFMAEQERPVARKVALKIIKLGMDTRAVIARFEAERQALAMMDHPNIARVLDVGATETGRPYFVMDLVKGDPIAEYCDKNNLSIEDRLELFAQVCNAVQHAHTKGIIHRDIKPSNILVSTQDGRPSAKVIDFGIAKATASKLTEKTLFTEHKALIGTPEYMSPEQAEGSLDIDTRTDVYSLGVLLYELLTGSTPFSSGDLRSAAFGEIQRIIREVEPPRPSTRLSQNTDTLASVAARRKTDPRRLGLIVRGELDWIVMKALEKDRARRYETANGLAMDVRRYLAGEAVVAAPPRRAYRLKKFVRRNKGVVVSGSAVGAALLVGLVAFAWQAQVAGEQRDIAVKAEKSAGEQLDRAVKAEKETKARAEELKTVAEFQAGMLEQIDPTKAGKELTEDVMARFTAALGKANPTMPEGERAGRAEAFKREWSSVNATDAARELIDRTILRPAIEAIDKDFKDQPLVNATLRATLALRYQELGLFEAAVPLEANALATRRRVLGDEHPDTLTVMSDLGAILQDQGKLAEAEPYRRESLAAYRRVLGEEHKHTITAIASMGFLLRAQGKLAEAEPLYREALEKNRRVLGKDDPATMKSVSNLSALLQARGKLAEAEPFCREALESRRRLLGEEHRDTLVSISNMGSLLQSLGKLEEAEPLYREALEKNRRLMGEEHPNTLVAINNLGTLLQAQSKYGEAEPYFREALEKRRRLLGAEHPNTLTSINNMGGVLKAQGKLAEAEPFYREAMEKRRRLLGEEHPNTLNSIIGVGTLLQAQGRLDEAEPYLREAMEKTRRVLGEEHLDALNSIGVMSSLLEAQGKLSQVIELLAPVEAAARKVLVGGNARRLAAFLERLGKARAAVGKGAAEFVVAEGNLLEAYGIFVKVRGEKHEDTQECVQAVADLYAAWDKVEPGKGFDVKAEEWKGKRVEKQGR